MASPASVNPQMKHRLARRRLWRVGGEAHVAGSSLRQARKQPTSSPVRFMHLLSVLRAAEHPNHLELCQRVLPVPLSSVRAGVERVVRPADPAPMKSLLGKASLSSVWSFGRGLRPRLCGGVTAESPL